MLRGHRKGPSCPDLSPQEGSPPPKRGAPRVRALGWRTVSTGPHPPILLQEWRHGGNRWGAAQTPLPSFLPNLPPPLRWRRGLPVSPFRPAVYLRSLAGASQVALVVKNPPANAGGLRDAGSLPGLGRSSGGGHGNPLQYSSGLSGRSDGKESACSVGDLDLIPGLGRSPGEGNGHLPQYSCLENFMDRGAWWATVHGGHKEWDTTD